MSVCACVRGAGLRVEITVCPCVRVSTVRACGWRPLCVRVCPRCRPAGGDHCVSMCACVRGAGLRVEITVCPCVRVSAVQACGWRSLCVRVCVCPRCRPAGGDHCVSVCACVRDAGLRVEITVCPCVRVSAMQACGWRSLCVHVCVCPRCRPAGGDHALRREETQVPRVRRHPPAGAFADVSVRRPRFSHPPSPPPSPSHPCPPPPPRPSQRDELLCELELVQTASISIEVSRQALHAQGPYARSTNSLTIANGTISPRLLTLAYRYVSAIVPLTLLSVLHAYGTWGRMHAAPIACL